MSQLLSVHATGRFPLVVSAPEPVSLVAFATEERARLDALMLEHGAILFRGFDLPGPADFERAAASISGDLFGEYGDLPRNAAGEKIYESTPYRQDERILFHNESAHLGSWPMRIGFYCVVPAVRGGATPILDVRAVMHQLDPAIVDAFRTKGLMYVRNFHKGVAPTWEDFFHTSDRAVVERMCRDAGAEFEWRRDGGLRVRQRAPGVSRHPITGDEVFFNQVQLHHVACVDSETREGLRALFDDADLPRHVYYGDGSPIPDDVMNAVSALYDRVCVRFTWERGDMIVLDNMLTAHARDTYEGPRQIVVAMAQIQSPAQA